MRSDGDAGGRAHAEARARARGRTLGGTPFTREQLFSAAVILGGDRPPPPIPDGEDWVADLVGCLAKDPGTRRWLDGHGIDLESLRDCLARRRGMDDPAELDRLG